MENNSTAGKIKNWIRDNWAIITICTIFLITRALFMTRNHDVIWDEAVYLGIGKYLWSFGGAGLWEIIRPLTLPLLVGTPWKIGLDQIFWGELIAIAFSTGCIILTYLIGKKVHTKNTGLMAAILTATTPTFFLYSGYILTDIPSTFFLLLAVYLFILNKTVASGFSSGLAFMTRYPQGLSLVALGGTLGLYYLIERKNEKGSDRFREIGKFVCAFSILPLIYMIINWFAYHKETSAAWHAIFRPWILASWHAGNPAEGADSALFYFKGIFGENFLLAIALVGIIWYFINKEYKKQEMTAVLITLIVYMTYFSSILNKQMRFAMPMIPLMAIISGYGLISSAEWIGFTPERKRITRACAMIILIGMTLLFIAPEDSKYFGWRHQAPEPVVEEVYKYFDTVGSDKVVLTADPLVAAYSSGYFEPFYFSVDSTAAIYDQTIGDAWGVLYVPEAFWCGTEDKTCKDGQMKLEEKIKRDNELVLEKKYGSDQAGYRTYQIWKKKA